MGQIIIPTDNKIKGPWLLDSKSLEELHETLITIESKLEEAFNVIVDRTAKSELEKYKRLEKDIDIEKAKLKVKNSYPFEKSEKYALIVSKQGKIIKDESLLALLKDSKLHDFKPAELHIQIKKGPCEFIMEISDKYDGALETRIKVLDDNLFNDINYELNKWINKYKPNVAMQKWSSWFPGVAFPIFIILAFLIPLFLKGKADIYKNKLSQESQEILKDGLTPQETNKAIEMLLQIQSGYIPEDFHPNIEINKTIRNIWLVALTGLIILLIKPRTVIGLGQCKWKVVFYRKWAYFVLVFIPLSIAFPIIRSRIF